MLIHWNFTNYSVDAKFYHKEQIGQICKDKEVSLDNKSTF